MHSYFDLKDITKIVNLINSMIKNKYFSRDMNRALIYSSYIILKNNLMN